MARTVDARITAIEIIVLLDWSARTVMRGRNPGYQIPIAGYCHVTLHGIGTFVDAIDRHSHHDQENQSGKKFEGN
jgi:hypothetical protein